MKEIVQIASLTRGASYQEQNGQERSNTEANKKMMKSFTNS